MSFWAAGASLVGGLLQGDAAGDAAATQAQSSAAAIAEQRRQYDLTRGDYAPYRGTGNAALRRYSQLIGLDVPGYGADGQPAQSREALRSQLLSRFTTGGQGAPQNRIELAGGILGGGTDYQIEQQGWRPPTQQPATAQTIDEQGLNAEIDRMMAAQQAGQGRDADFGSALEPANAMNEPGYRFGLEQGQLGLDRKIAASGGRVSGAALKAASEYNTNYASTRYEAADQRRENRLNRLAALAGIGQSATGSVAGYGAQTAGAISGLTSAQGNAAAAGQLATGNIWANAANQLGAAGQRWAGGSNAGGLVPATEIPLQPGGGY